MAEAHHLFRDKLADLFKAEGLPVKSLFVGRSGTLTVTLHGEATARKVAALVDPFAAVRHVGAGFDPGQSTAVHNARRADVRVWRVHGSIRPKAA